jgi:flagellar motor switch/type III secretory pathway protein FliN
MLGEDERPHLTSRDLRLLRRLAGEALDDLVARLEATLPAGGAGAAGDGARRSLTLAMAGEPLLEVTLDRTDLCLLAQRTFTPRGHRTSLAPAATAFADVAVPVAGRLGRAALAIDQIGALEPGDVLVLDRELDEAVELLVAGRDSPLRCDITERDGAIGLVVREPN